MPLPLIALLVWVAAAVVVAAVVARATHLRNERDPRDGVGGSAPSATGSGVVIDLTVLPAVRRGPSEVPGDVRDAG